MAHSSTASVSTNEALGENDIVTIGNVDFVFTNGALVRLTEPAAHDGGLEVRDVSLDASNGELRCWTGFRLTHGRAH